VIQLTLDSLRYWVREFHVDGFRFDLSVTLGREGNGFDPGSGFFDAMMQDPTLARVKLIAEPWDLGPGGYQLGNHPAGMAEWNDSSATMCAALLARRFGLRGALAARLQGSADLFDHDGRRPWASLNFITAHDGFTLQDWVSYNQQAQRGQWRGQPRWHRRQRQQQLGRRGADGRCRGHRAPRAVKRAMLATLLFSHGTPMLLGGDEFGRTQQGNNNAYCQDNRAVAGSTGRRRSRRPVLNSSGVCGPADQLRREHCSLRSDYYQHGQLEPLPQVRDIEWFDESGDVMRPEDWQLHRRAAAVRTPRTAAGRGASRGEPAAEQQHL
jgi:isoamylase